jgi:nucleoside-diphosphate-sugar epimerase
MTNYETVLITGASNGSIGAAVVLALAAAKPKTIFLAGRNKAKVDPVIEEFRKENTTTGLIYVPLDTSDQDSVRAAAATVDSQVDTLDILLNNAGIMCTMPYTTSPQGIELQFATNHIGHFLLTALLMPKIKAAGPGSRIVHTSSTGLQLCDPTFENYNWDVSCPVSMKNTYFFFSSNLSNILVAGRMVKPTTRGLHTPSRKAPRVSSALLLPKDFKALVLPLSRFSQAVSSPPSQQN